MNAKVLSSGEISLEPMRLVAYYCRNCGSYMTEIEDAAYRGCCSERCLTISQKKYEERVPEYLARTLVMARMAV